MSSASGRAAYLFSQANDQIKLNRRSLRCLFGVCFIALRLRGLDRAILFFGNLPTPVPKNASARRRNGAAQILWEIPRTPLQYKAHVH
jgi:hypothetical protein